MCLHYHAAQYDPAIVPDLMSVRAHLYRGPIPFGGFNPLSSVPVIRAHGLDILEITSLEWGLLPAWWKPNGRQLKRTSYQKKCVNAPAELIHKQKYFEQAFESRRCLLLADKFFEGRYWFHLPDYQPFAFAGLWESWTDGEEIVESCAIVTTAANDTVSNVHDRMPLILSGPEHHEKWLDTQQGNPTCLEQLLTPYQGKLLSSKGEKISQAD